MFNRKKRRIKDLEEQLSAQKDRIRVLNSVKPGDTWIAKNISIGQYVFNRYNQLRKIIYAGENKYLLLRLDKDSPDGTLVVKHSIPSTGLTKEELFNYMNKEQYVPVFFKRV